MVDAVNAAAGKLRQCRTILSVLIGRLQKVRIVDDGDYDDFVWFRRQAKQALEKLGEVLFALEGGDVNTALASLGQFGGQARSLLNRISALDVLKSDARQVSDELAVMKDLSSQASDLLMAKSKRKAA
jgi:hypothetical protein